MTFGFALPLPIDAMENVTMLKVGAVAIGCLLSDMLVDVGGNFACSWAYIQGSYTLQGIIFIGLEA